MIEINDGNFLLTCVVLITIDLFLQRIQVSGDKGKKVVDFSKLVLSKTYVDKSLLIKEVLDEKNKVIYVTAPPRFGKSLSLDMLKRFLQVQRDKNTKLKSDKTFKLFKNLLIYKKEKEFFKKHFGKYPVVYIDYSPLRKVQDHGSAMKKLRGVLLETFKEHRYLLKAKMLWKGKLKVKKFKKYTKRKKVEKLKVDNIGKGFVFLCKVLEKHFRTKVFVLIDGYDAYVKTIIFNEYKDGEKILDSMLDINRQFLKCSYIERALLTGTLRITGKGLIPNGIKLEDYPYSLNIKYSKYYGITNKELVELFKRNKSKKDFQKAELKEKTFNHYQGYNILADEKNRLHNFVSVRRFMENGKFGKYLDGNLLDNFKRLLAKREIKSELVELIQGRNFPVENIHSWSWKNIKTVRKLLKGKQIFMIKPEVELCLYLLFEFGFFTIDKLYENTILKFPNLGAERILLANLNDVVLKNYKQSRKRLKSFYFIINSISGDETKDEKTFHKLREKLRKMYKHAPELVTPKDIYNDLFLMLRPRYGSLVRTSLEKPGVGRLGLWFINSRNVSFIIEANVTDKKAELDDCASEAIGKIVTNSYVNIIEPRFRRYTVYLSLCHDTKTKDVVTGFLQMHLKVSGGSQ